MDKQVRSTKTDQSLYKIDSSERGNNRWKSTDDFTELNTVLPNSPAPNKWNNYDQDEIPVKDVNGFNDRSLCKDYGFVPNKDSLINSNLDKLETDILRKMSQKLQTEVSSVSLDSNIKLFKATVENIFNNFYHNVQEYEQYKMKFNEILQKYRGDSVAEMESFIKEVLKNISSTECNVYKCKSNQTSNARLADDRGRTTLQSFKNENYAESTMDIDNSKSKMNSARESLNIYLLSDRPCVEIKMDRRDLLSEINIREKSVSKLRSRLASAESIKKVAAKRRQLETYICNDEIAKHELGDRNIPIKNSNAKKDLYLNEDFSRNKDENDSFSIFKICSYICKKIRKNLFA